MSNIELVKVEVVVHATLKIDGNTVHISLVDKGGGDFVLAPEQTGQEHEIPDYILDQIHQKLKNNRGTD